MPTMKPCLWFDDQAMQAAELYVSVFPNSRILDVGYHGPDGPGGPGTNPRNGEVMAVEFELDGDRFVGLNGGPLFTFSEAISFQMHCATQEEADRYWAALTADGGQESQCGWLKDKFGVSWQIIPDGVIPLLSDPDPERARRAAQAMFTMQRLDLQRMRRAADGDTQ